jgi:hypothetical protein
MLRLKRWLRQNSLIRRNWQTSNSGLTPADIAADPNLVIEARMLRLKRWLRQDSLIRRNWLTFLEEGATCFRLAIPLPLDYYWNAQLMRMNERSVRFGRNV